jgi:hypothetical protein
MTFDTNMDLLASGPVIQLWEGIVQTTPKEFVLTEREGVLFWRGIDAQLEGIKPGFTS